MANSDVDFIINSVKAKFMILRPWQKKVATFLSSDPEDNELGDRAIYFFVDTVAVQANHL